MAGEPIAGGQVDGAERLGQRADLVDLDQQRVRGLGLDAAPQPLRVGHEQVITDDLHPAAQARGQLLPAVPVVLAERVFERDDRVGVEPALVDRRHVGGRLDRAFEVVALRAVELTGRRVDRQRDVLARGQAGLADRLDDQVERGLVVLQVRGEAALVADASVQVMLLQHRLQRVVGLGAPAQRLGERRRADRRDHELLDVDVGVRVSAAVEDVHHRHRQQVRVRSAEVAEQRQLGRLGGGPGDGQADAEDRVGAEPGLVRRAVEVDHREVDQALVARVLAEQLGLDLLDDRAYGLLDALAAVLGVAVAEFDRLERAGRRAGGHGRPGLREVVEHDFDLDGWVATRIQDLPGMDGFDRRHEFLPGARLIAPVREPTEPRKAVRHWRAGAPC